MKFNTTREYKREIARVDAAMKRTDSVFILRDYGKYKRKLEKEMLRCADEEVRQRKGHS